MVLLASYSPMGVHRSKPVADCGTVSIPSDGGVSYPNGTTTYNSIVVYSCDTGYVTSGSGQRLCQADGQWSGADQTCEGMCSLLDVTDC